MECLKNYIQIDGCSAPAYNYVVDYVAQSPSDLYINRDLPLSIKKLDKIADEEQKTFLGVWNEIQDRALRKFVIVVKAGYKELFGVCNIIDDDWFCTNRELLAQPLLFFFGSELMSETLYTDRINRYTTIDRDRARELKADCDEQFQATLKNALELINADTDQEAGDVFSYVESIP